MDQTKCLFKYYNEKTDDNGKMPEIMSFQHGITWKKVLRSEQSKTCDIKL